MITLTLDTRPPRIAVVGETRVSYPDDMIIEVTSSKVIGAREYEVLDAAGQVHRLGYSRVGVTMDLVVIPSILMPCGDALFHALVVDELGNEAEDDGEFYVDSPIPFNVRAEQDEIYGMVVSAGRPYDVMMVSRSPYLMRPFYNVVLDIDSIDVPILSMRTSQTLDGG